MRRLGEFDLLHRLASFQVAAIAGYSSMRRMYHIDQEAREHVGRCGCPIRCRQAARPVRSDSDFHSSTKARSWNTEKRSMRSCTTRKSANPARFALLLLFVESRPHRPLTDSRVAFRSSPCSALPRSPRHVAQRLARNSKSSRSRVVPNHAACPIEQRRPHASSTTSLHVVLPDLLIDGVTTPYPLTERFTAGTAP